MERHDRRTIPLASAERVDQETRQANPGRVRAQVVSRFARATNLVHQEMHPGEGELAVALPETLDRLEARAASGDGTTRHRAGEKARPERQPQTQCLSGPGHAQELGSTIEVLVHQLHAPRADQEDITGLLTLPKKALAISKVQGVGELVEAEHTRRRQLTNRVLEARLAE